MANTYFQFKHFRVDQDLCGMKVCTDACILGAVAPVKAAKKIIDIGTGTGLLALMAAQRNTDALIDAVEIDEAAAAQAKNNAAKSQWSDRITVYQAPLQNFTPEKEKQYDLIISNPPFFVNSLKPELQNERIARHTDSLTFAEIVSFASRHLMPQGRLCILLPPPEQQIFASAALKYGLRSLKNLSVKDRAEGKVLRVISTYGFSDQQTPIEELLVIKQPNGQYTARFRELLKDFYLAF